MDDGSWTNSGDGMSDTYISCSDTRAFFRPRSRYGPQRGRDRYIMRDEEDAKCVSFRLCPLISIKFILNKIIKMTQNTHMQMLIFVFVFFFFSQRSDFFMSSMQQIANPTKQEH